MISTIYEKKSNSNLSQIAGLDFIKLIMAFCVILIHIPPVFYNTPAAYGPFVDWLIKLAVPFFFITSGYFLQRKLSTLNSSGQRHYLESRIKKLIKIYACWLLIYFPFSLYNFYKSGLGLGQNIINYFYGILTTGETAFAWPLWYLYSMIIVFTLVLLFRRIKAYKVILILCFAFLSIINWLNEPDGIFFYIRLYTDRTLGGGLPIILGMFLAQKNILLKPMSIILESGILSVVLYFFKLPYWQYIGGILLFIFGVSLRIPYDSLFKFMRRQSMWIYYTHMYVLMVMLFTFRYFNYQPSLFTIIILAFILNYMLSSMLVIAERKKGLNKIGFLIS